MVLESGLPELEDIEDVLSANWNDVWRPWFYSSFLGVYKRLIDIQTGVRGGSLDNLRQIRAEISSVAYQQGAYHTATIDYLKTVVVGAIGARVESEAETTRALVKAHDPTRLMQAEHARILASVQWYDPYVDLIYQETTRNSYRDDPARETLRGMISTLRWEILVGSQDKERGFFSGLFGDLAGVPGAVVEGLAGSLEESVKATTDAISASQEAIWALLEETQKNIGEALGGIFGDFFKPEGLIGMILPNWKGALDAFEPGALPAQVTDMIQANEKAYEAMYVSSSPRTPEEAKKFANAWAIAGNLAITGIVGATIAAECLSLGQIDFTLGSIFQIPTLKSWMGTLEAFREARDEPALLIPLRQHYMRQHTPMIPSSTDLITMVVREAFKAELVTPAPDLFAKYMELQGFSKEWSDRYWTAHWVLPPLVQCYEMFHRKIINERELDTYLELHDYRGRDRPRLKALSYELIPRIDLRRALDYGQLEFEDLPGRYEDLGFSEEDAGVMANIARRFSLTAERSDLRRLYERRFLLGFIEEDEFRGALAGLEFGSGVIDERTKYILLRRSTDEEVRARKLTEEIEVKELTVSQLGRALKYGRIQESEYNDRLADYGYAEDDIRILRERILDDPVVDAQESVEREIIRTKTRTYRRLYAEDRIGRADLLTNLLAIGVAEELAMAIADFEDAKKIEVPKEEETAEEKARKRRIRQMRGSTAREQYRRWQIDLKDLVDALQSYDYDVDEARAIGGYEEIRRPSPPVPEELVEDEKRRLEVKRLEGLAARARFRQGVISRDGLERELVALEYHEEIARAMANLEAARMPVPAMTEEERDLAKAEARAKRLRESALRTLYRTWQITETDLRECLLAIPLDPSVVQGILDLERARRPEEPIPPEEKERLKHEAEVRSWKGRVEREKYRKAKISKEELYSALVAAGYPEDVAYLIREYEVYHRLPKPK